MSTPTTTKKMTGFERHLLALLGSVQVKAGDESQRIPIISNGRSEISPSSPQLDEIDYNRGVFPFYSGGEGKTEVQMLIEASTVGLLDRLQRQEAENDKLRDELSRSSTTTTTTATTEGMAGMIPSGLMNVPIVGKMVGSLLTPDDTPPAVPEDNGRQEMRCPTCSRSATSSSTSPTTTTLVSNPTSTSNTIATTDGRDSPLSPEKELELLRAQVRDIARVCRAVAMGDLENKITVPVEGPIMSELKEVINGMVDQLKRFAGEVERVATEGELGGEIVRVDGLGLGQALIPSELTVVMTA
jgi:hypothetical protein